MKTDAATRTYPLMGTISFSGPLSTDQLVALAKTRCRHCKSALSYGTYVMTTEADLRSRFGRTKVRFYHAKCHSQIEDAKLDHTCGGL